MSRLKTTFTILRYSFNLMRRHPRLLAYPVASLVAMALTSAFLLLPLISDITAAQIWQAFGSEEARKAIFEAIAAPEGPGSGPFHSGSFTGFVAFHLVGMFVTNFINVAFYSQIIEIMNGGRASVLQGFALSFRRLGEITAWSLVAGLISVLLGALEEGSGMLMGIAGLARVVWEVTSLFVIPVMINEPQAKRLMEYLRISIALLKRVWAEGAIGFVGMALAFVVLMLTLTMVDFVLLAGREDADAAMSLVPYLTLISFSVFLGIFVPVYLAFQIFQCGLYVYATQGVAPGTFNEEMFDRTWTVGSSQQEIAEDGSHKTARRVSRAWLWLILPITMGGVAFWITFARPVFSRFIYSDTVIASAAINLAELEYRLNMSDIHAAGLLTREKCRRCDFSNKKSKIDVLGTDAVGEYAGMQAIMFKEDRYLYLHFYGPDVTAGKERVRRALDILRSRYPGHESSFAFMYNFKVSWNAMPGAASYMLEFECVESSQPSSWCWKNGPFSGLTETTATLPWVGDQAGHWRVWPVDSTGHEGPKSDWTEFNTTH